MMLPHTPIVIPISASNEWCIMPVRLAIHAQDLPGQKSAGLLEERVSASVEMLLGESLISETRRVKPCGAAAGQGLALASAFECGRRAGRNVSSRHWDRCSE